MPVTLNFSLFRFLLQVWQLTTACMKFNGVVIEERDF